MKSIPVTLDLSYQPDKQSLQVNVEKTPDSLKNIKFVVKDIGKETRKFETFTLKQEEVLIGLRLAMDGKGKIH